MESTPPTRATTLKVSLSPHDKPLPTPPIAQIDSTSPVELSASLIEASEKPLSRLSVRMPQQEEEWPVLHPQRSSSPGTIQEMMRESGIQLRQQIPPPNDERYPKLGDLTHQPSAEKLPVSRYSPRHPIPRKGVSTPNLQGNSEAPVSDADIVDPFQDGVNVTDANIDLSSVTSPPNLSAGAVAMEKSSLRTSTEPRQTRTSSLRARLSTGSIVKDRNSKVIGFTDFTAPTVVAATGLPRRDSLRMRKEAQARSAPPSTATSIHTEVSKDSLANRAPAKFVAGSRRPVPPRRPGSRGSGRSEARSSSPSATSYPSDRSAPPMPPMKDEVPHDAMRPELPLRRSSIPVPKLVSGDSRDVGRKSIPVSSNTTAPKKLASLKTERKQPRHDSVYTKQALRDGVEIFDDRSLPSAAQDKSHKAVVGMEEETAKIAGTTETKQIADLPAIVESPPHKFQFKRLSAKSPEYGPTLTISPSADRYIMGLQEDKENFSLDNKPMKDLKRSTDGNGRTQQVNGKISTATKKRLERPLSVHGASASNPRAELVNLQTREKKTRSADFGTITKSTAATLTVTQALSKNPSVATHASSADDPFYDAAEEPVVDTDSVLKGSTQIEEFTPLEQQLATGKHDSYAHKVTVTQDKREPAQDAAEYDPFKYGVEYDPTTTKEPKPQKDLIQDETSTAAQMPLQVTADPASRPTRSSSRVGKPDSVTTGSKGSSTKSASQSKDYVTPPKDFVHRQNNLGSARGHGSSQLDFAKPANKRESVARESLKSQTSLPNSLSRSRFNLKTLFHKRSSDRHQPTKSSKKAKQKVTIDNNGSPFPPISEVHPIHRPTLASTARASTSNPGPPMTASSSRARTPPTSTLMSPEASEISRTTTLAMSILESARREDSSPKKEKLLDLGKVLVDVITQARDAERAVEEARLCVRRAEKAEEHCRWAVGEVGRLAEGLKGGREW